MVQEMREIEVPDISPEAEARRQKIIEIASDAPWVKEGEVEIDENARLSESGDNGCYVAAWTWCDFSDTELDKDENVPCSDCCAKVSVDADGFSTFCGTRCNECLETHAKECELCADILCDGKEDSV